MQLPKFKSERLQALIVVVILVMQFILTMSGHRQLEINLSNSANQVAQYAAESAARECGAVFSTLAK